jgi:lupus La protein
LRETVEADPAGYVDISLLMTFSRLRTLLARVSNAHHVESAVDVAALLETSKVLAVSTDKRRVRRISELRPREVVDAEVEQRSVYASPFPMDVSIDDLTKFFSKHTKILSIRLRRHVSSKDFKGSIFLELPDAASCAALILKSGELEFDGAPLNLVKKQTYLSSKKVQVR